MHACMHAYIQTDRQTYRQTYIHMYVRIYLRISCIDRSVWVSPKECVLQAQCGHVNCLSLSQVFAVSATRFDLHDCAFEP